MELFVSVHVEKGWEYSNHSDCFVFLCCESCSSLRVVLRHNNDAHQGDHYTNCKHYLKGTPKLQQNITFQSQSSTSSPTGNDLDSNDLYSTFSFQNSNNSYQLNDFDCIEDVFTLHSNTQSYTGNNPYLQNGFDFSTNNSFSQLAADSNGLQFDYNKPNIPAQEGSLQFDDNN